MLLILVLLVIEKSMVLDYISYSRNIFSFKFLVSFCLLHLSFFSLFVFISSRSESTSSSRNSFSKINFFRLLILFFSKKSVSSNLISASRFATEICIKIVTTSLSTNNWQLICFSLRLLRNVQQIILTVHFVFL